VSFSAPSFSAGLVLGGALVLLLPYLVSMLEESPIVNTGTPVAEEVEIIFDFDSKLAKSEVTTDPSAYPVEFESTTPDANASTYLLQAASFRSLAEATDLQAKLSRQDLPATVSQVSVNGKAWYRVTVGPFNRQKEAQRAMTRLRENNLSPLPLKRG
jgi:cell division protein FtsN